MIAAGRIGENLEGGDSRDLEAESRRDAQHPDDFPFSSLQTRFCH